MGRNNEQHEEKSRSKIYIIMTLIGSLCIGICFVTGCFSGHQEVLSQQTVVKKEKPSYDILVDQWNNAVLAADLNRSFELPRNYDKSFFQKIDNLVNNTNDYKKFASKNQCVLTSEKKAFIPSVQYANFLKENQFSYKVTFDQNYTEEEIIQELKKVTNSKYINAEMLRKVAYLQSFELFFNDKKKSFYEQGFNKYIKNYRTYLKAVSRCK